MRNGADYSVYINTASEYDGSDAEQDLTKLFHGVRSNKMLNQ